jgi:cytochrome P450
VNILTVMALPLLACLLLAQHPQVGAQVRGEVSSVLAGRAPTLADLPRLALTRRVIDETLRLYPPVAAIAREAYGPDEIDGYAIPAKSGVMMSPYVTHRHPAFWQDPERFDPDRFTPENSATRPRFAYFPFSGGPRLCIGETFALMEAQLIVAMMLQRYRLTLVDPRPLVPEPTLTIRPRGGLVMRAEPVGTAIRDRRAS